MLEKWLQYQAKIVLTETDCEGNRLISLFARDYKMITGQDICPSCNDFQEKFNRFIKKLENMSKLGENTGFKLKAMYDNIAIHGSQSYFMNETLTDTSALELLTKHPRGKELFEELPENVDELISSYAQPAPVEVEKAKELSLDLENKPAPVEVEKKKQSEVQSDKAQNIQPEATAEIEKGL